MRQVERSRAVGPEGSSDRDDVTASTLDAGMAAQVFIWFPRRDEERTLLAGYHAEGA
jgi:hypothetical protein